MASNAQIEGAIRSIVIGVGGFTGAAGWLQDIDWVAIGGALATIGGLIWSIYSNRIDRLLAQSAASPKVVEILTTTEKLAEAVPSPKVIAVTARVKPTPAYRGQR